MTWTEKQTVLARLGHRNFESEEEYDEWFGLLENYQQREIKKAFCQYNELPHFNWSRNYFTTNKKNKYVKIKQH